MLLSAKPLPPAPVDVLPVEILTVIFALYHELAPSIGEVFESTTSPLPLLLVCKHWRNVALSMSELWTSLTFQVPENGAEIPSTWPRVLDIWLSRSQQRRVSLDIWGPFSDTFDWTQLEPLFERHAARIEHLDLAVVPKVATTLFDKWEIDFPVLEYAALSVKADDEEPCAADVPWKKYHTLFNSTRAPALSHLQLDFLPLNTLQFPCATLTRFTYTDIFIIECLFVFKYLPALVECEMTLYRGYDAGHLLVFNPYVHYALRVLSLRTPDGADLATILAALAFPNLEALHLHSAADPLDAQRIAAFLERSAPPLRDLSLDASTFQDLSDPDASFAFSSLSSTLESLLLQDPSAHQTKTLFTSLASGSLPRLQSLHLHTRGPAFSDLALPFIADLASLALPQRASLAASVAGGWADEGEVERAQVRPITSLCAACLLDVDVDGDVIMEDERRKLRVLMESGVEVAVGLVEGAVDGDVFY